MTSKIICISLILLFFIFSPVLAKIGEKGKDLNMESPFGVLEFLNWNHAWNNYKYSRKEDFEIALSLMKEAGIAWVRMDFLWEEIEPQEGKFEFEKYDKIVDLLSDNKIHVLGILNYSAPWAASAGWNSAPKDNQLFVNYSVKVIEHYKNKIKHWEVWNEPDSPNYWVKQDGLKSYCALLKDVYLAAKKAVPDCIILNGGLANGISSVNLLYDNGAKNYFDILNVHFFENPVRPNTIKAVINYPKLAYKIMARNGDGAKKIWITETGCPGIKPNENVAEWWLGPNPDENIQAVWLKDVYMELLKDSNVEKIFWAFFRDSDGHWNDGTDYFGMIRWDFSKKPSFSAYQECVANWKKKQE